MQRKILRKLIEWKNSPDRKPLILEGARQVGKTYLIREIFGKEEYENILYVNMQNPSAEVDFVGQFGWEIVPLEVKSGENVRARSLKVYREAYQPSLAVRMSMKALEENDGLLNIPLYESFVAKREIWRRIAKAG